MAEQRRRPQSSPRLRPPGGPSQQQPQPGWRVTPAPDGRGRPAKPPSGPNIRWIAVLLVVGLIALNFWISSRALSPSPRVRIPYSPTFLTEANENNIQSISSAGA
jgi:cell division protease FtsH